MYRAFIIIIVLFIIKISSAQTIVVDAIRLSDDTLGWQTAVDINFYSSKSKSEFIKADARSKMQYRKAKSIYKVFGNYNIVVTNKEEIEEKAFFQLRYNHIINELLVLEAFTQGQTDQVLRINFRGLAGLGPKFRFFNEKKLSLDCAALYMYEYEEEKDTNIYHRDHRLSVNYFLNILNGKVIKLRQFSYFQPQLNNFEDYRLSTGLLVEARITKLVRFNFSANLNYDVAPVVESDIPNFTYSILNGIGLRF